MGAAAFDLADRLQTPVFVMLDLDIGMNEWLCRPFAWDDSRRMDRGKVMTREMLDAGVDFGRYLDVDGDGIPYRTYPGTHPTRGSYFTRGTTRDRYARYSEEGPVYIDNMERLAAKFETAKRLVPAPIERPAAEPSRAGVIYFGSTGAAMDEALDVLEAAGSHLDTLRLRAFPFPDAVGDFIRRHDVVFVVEQNRDGQMRNLLITECSIDPARLVGIRHYDGTPITARFIVDAIAEALPRANVVPLRKAVP
jgi:2-oxoglutarate ferredoxin oxidoreductase subunit alpha